MMTMMFNKFSTIWLSAVALSLVFSLSSCSDAITKGVKQGYIYGTWNVEFIKTPDRQTSGKEMGNPTYTFSKEGKRIKRLAGHDEMVSFMVKGKTIEYPGTKLPPTKIINLTKNKLVLQNDKTYWVLFK